MTFPSATLKNKFKGETITLSKIMELIEASVRKGLAVNDQIGKHYRSSVELGNDIYFTRIDDKVVCTINPETYITLFGDSDIYNMEIIHNPHLIVMPVEVD